MIARLRQSLTLLPVLAALAGCSTGSRILPTTPQTATSGFHGAVHGGQQPIVGATIQLYAVGTTGDGSAATPLLTPALTTDSSGFFNLSGHFTCPATNSLLYLVATGGNPGLPPPATNHQSALMVALGPCDNPTGITYINVSEVTTVAAVYALAPYMTGIANVGSSPADTQALLDAFTLAAEFANPNTGTSPGLNIPTGTTIPTAEINTLANLLSGCVNSAGGVSGDSSVCGQIFALTTPSGTTPPTDAITAILHLAQNPGLNTQALYNLVLATAPFQPNLTEQPPNFAVNPTVPSDFTVSPSSLNFGSIFVSGTTASQSVTISNNTTHALNVSNYQILGANSSDFSYSSPQPACPSTIILPGSSCQVLVSFTPTAAGARHAYLVIQNTSPNPFLAIPLSGTGTAGATEGPVTIAPGSLSLSYGTPQPLTLTNAGTTPLTISNITFSTDANPTYAGLYTQTNDCGTTLQAQSICTITVSVHAIGVSSNAVMTVVDDAAAGPQTVAVSLSGSPNTFPDYIDFGRISFYNPEFQGEISVASPSNSSIGLSFTPPVSGEFTFSRYTQNVFCQYGPCNSVIETHPFDSPLGLVTDNITISSPGGGGGIIPVRMTVVGAGQYFVARLHDDSGNTVTTPPPVSVVNFNSPVGQSQTVFFDITYTGGNADDPNDFQGVAGVFFQDHRSEFPPSENYCSGIAISSCTIYLTFLPTTVESFTTTGTIESNSGNITQTLTIHATATAPGVTASTTQLTFPATVAGTVSTPQSLTASALTSNGVKATVTGPFQITQGATCTSTPCTVSVAFAPLASASAGTKTGTLTISDPLTNSQATVALSGSATVQTTASVSSTSLTFPSRSVNSTSIPQTITVTNTGTTNALTITSASLTGADPGDYVITNGCTGNVAPGSSCNINISFSPKNSGTRTDTLSIVSSSTTSPDTVSITGTAVSP